MKITPIHNTGNVVHTHNLEKTLITLKLCSRYRANFKQNLYILRESNLTIPIHYSIPYTNVL